MILGCEIEMTTLLATLTLSFLIFATAVLVINFCKSRPKNGKHQLTGMCHCSGSASSCDKKGRRKVTN